MPLTSFADHAHRMGGREAGPAAYGTGGRPKVGDTVMVSTAAGSVGSVGQG